MNAQPGQPITISRVLLAAAAVCFAVAVLIALGAFGNNEPAWLAGGLLAFVLSFLIP